VGEQPHAGDVADRPQPVGDTQMRVDSDAVTLGLDTDGVQAEPLDARRRPVATSSRSPRSSRPSSSTRT
jgi:hypothetical protein